LRLVNPINRFMLRRGFGPSPQHLLLVAGRKSGTTRTTPVAVVSVDGQRYVVAGYDGSDWVKNARAAGRGELLRGRDVEQVALTEVPLGERGRIIKAFAQQVRGGTAFLTVAPDAPIESFSAAAARHPVFRVSPVVDPSAPTRTT
jgi:deazaflavin-dependent oxidoreductase (nitroreductase family)